MNFKTRMLSVGLVGVSLAASALAQVEGPSPLSWRWVQSASVAPVGSPLVDGNTVYVAVGQRVYALDKDSGNQRWKYPPVEPINGTFRVEPIKVGGMLVCAADNKTVYGIDPATGDKKWQYLGTASIAGQPVPIGDKQVGLAFTDNTVLVINAATGESSWSTGPQKIFDGITGRVSSYQDNLLVMTQSNNLLAMDGTNGKQRWTRSFTQLDTDSRAVPYGDAIYVNSGSYVVCLSGGSGQYRWDKDAGAPIPFAPAVSPDGVAVVTRDGNIVVFGSRDGRRVTHPVTDPVTRRATTADTIALGSFPIAPPSAIGHVFVFPGTAGTITMFDPKTGSLLWNYTIKPLTRTDTTASQPSSGPGTLGLGGPGRGSGLGTTGFGNGGSTGANKEAPAPVSIPAAGPAVQDGDSIFVLARDGSILAFDRQTGVDLTPPDVSMAFPKPGDQVSTAKGLEVHFQIDDEASGLRVDSVNVAVDGKKLDYTLSRSGDLAVRFSMSGKNGYLNDGRHVFTITATDWMGNTSTSTYGLTVDNSLPPVAAPKPAPGAGGDSAPGGLRGG